jgi:hypothetical protein
MKNSYRPLDLEKMRRVMKRRGFVGLECVLLDMIDNLVARNGLNLKPRQPFPDRLGFKGYL